MGIANIINNSTTTSGGEIVRELVNSSDGAGLHFDGSAGNIDIASPPDLGTKFSFEFVVKADSWPASGSNIYIVDFGNGGRFVLGNPTTGNFSVRSVTGAWISFGSPVLDDLTVHHIVVTVDGTSAIAYDNGNQIGTATINSPNIDSCADARIGSDYVGTASFFTGTIYRARFYNKTLTSAEVQTAFERADVPVVDQHGSPTETSTNSFVNSGFAGFSGNAAGFTTTGSANGNVAYKNQTFTGGKKYRLKFTIADGNSSNLLLLFRSSTGGAGSNVGTIESTNLGSVVSGTYLEVSASGNYELIVSNLGSAQSMRFFTGGDVGAIDINSFSIFQIGCVSDYDLAFANPTQSLTVQDRSGAADGTASSSTAVTQVQPVVQLNSEELRVAGSAPKIGVGLANTVTPAGKLHVHGADGEGYLRLSTDTTGATASDGARIGYNGSDLRIQNFENSKVQFFTNNTTEALTISSTGQTTVTASGTSVLHVNRTTSNGDAIIVESGGNDRVRIGTEGITFPNGGTAPASAVANRLNYYEEGTFDALLTFGGGNTGITYALNSNKGIYTRIGNMVYISLIVELTNKGTSTGTALINGLPFIVSDELAATSLENALTSSFNNVGLAHAYATGSTPVINLKNSSNNSLTSSDFSNSSSIRLAGWYTTP